MGLLFTNPEQISVSEEPESLIIRLKDFRDPNGELIAKDQEIRKSLPTQINPSMAEALQAAGSIASASVGTSLSFNFVLNILMRTSLNSMLSAIKFLQIVVHLTLLSVIVPANAQIFYGAIAEIVAFDPIELDTLFDFGFKMRPDEDYALDEDLQQKSCEDDTKCEE